MLYWTDEKIQEEIRSVMEALNLKRMPSRSEIDDYCGDSKLTNAIGKNGGHYNFALRMGIDTKESETKIGDFFERYALAELTEKGYEVERMSLKHPYDILVNGHVKIDVKCSTAYMMHGISIVNTVGLSKDRATCDLYLIYLLDTGGHIDRTLIIPGHEVKMKYLNIGKSSKYNKYIDRWDLIDIYDEVKTKISGIL